MELTGVGHELKRAAEFPVPGRRAGPHVEHIGSEGGEALDVSVPRRGFYDSVASLILVLRTTNNVETGEGNKEETIRCGFLTVYKPIADLEMISLAERDPSPSRSI